MTLKNIIHPMWQKPLHHQDLQQKDESVHWIELFYDLIHVVAIFLLGTHLTDNLNLLGFISFSFLFVSMWISWGDYAFYNSLYVSRDYKHRIISAFHILTVMAMAGSIPSIMSDGLVYFMLAYAANRFITAFLYYRARKHNALSQTLACEMFRNFFLLGIIFLVAAFLSTPYNLILFGSGLIGLQLVYLLPKTGIMRFKNFTPRLEHLSERFSLLLLICLGEGYFKMVLALGEKGIGNVSIDILINYFLGGLGIFMLAWMYFDFVGTRTVKNLEKRTLVQWWYSHLGLMFCALLISVALKAEVKVHYYEPYPFKYAILGCLGATGYFICLELIQSTIKNQIAHRFANFRVKLLGIFFILMALVLSWIEGPSWLGNLLYGLGLASQLVIPITHAFYTYKDEVHQMHREQIKG